ncbi:hypothetical protein HY404_02190 [Candidatus Microgenomates bacterium]|nr:hypothetical protein [Candidatus Microgenomates bacterium]
MDEALLRAGRFDSKVEVGLPDPDARRLVLKIHLSGKPGADLVDLERLVEIAAGRSPAEIAGAVNAGARQAAMRAARTVGAFGDELNITTNDIAAELGKILPTREHPGSVESM